MRIDTGTLLAVLLLAAWLPILTCASPSNRSATSRWPLHHRRSTRRATHRSPPPEHHQPHWSNDQLVIEEDELEEDGEDRGLSRSLGFSFGARMGIKQMQQMLMREGRGIDCCPSRTEMTTPDGGITRGGDHVILFKNNELRQTFYEQTCLPGVEDKPCFFLDRRMHNQSRCVQKRSYTYALVLNPGYSDESSDGASLFSSQELPSFTSPNSKWMMDYIQINSGCACEVQPKHRRKKHDKMKKSKNKKFDPD